MSTSRPAGPRVARGAAPHDDAAAPYAGQRLGLPPSGPGAVAGWGRRMVALCVDWLVSSLAAAAALGRAVWGQGPEQFAPMGMFVLEATLLTALLGGSFGQLVCRVAVLRMDGRTVTLLAAFARTVLVCLVVPPLIFNQDRRGLHDLALKTITRNR